MYKNNNIKFAKKFTDSPLAKGSLYGALSGVLGGGIGTILYNLIKKNKWYKNVLPAVLIGGTTGGIAGLGGGAIYERMKKRMANKKLDDLLAKVKKHVPISKENEKRIRQATNQAIKTNGKELLTPEVRDILRSKLQKFNAREGDLLLGEKVSEELNRLSKQENISKDDVKNLIKIFEGSKSVALDDNKKSEIVKYLKNIINVVESGNGNIEAIQVPEVSKQDVAAEKVFGNGFAKALRNIEYITLTTEEMEKEKLRAFRYRKYYQDPDSFDFIDFINHPPKNHEDYKSKYKGMSKEELKDKLKYIVKEHKKFRKLKKEAEERYDALNSLYGRQEVEYHPLHTPREGVLKFVGGLIGRGDNEEFLEAATSLSHYENVADKLYEEATVMKNILRDDKPKPKSKSGYGNIFESLRW